MAFNKEKVMDAARKFVDKGQIDKAVKEYLRIVNEDPKDVRVWLKIGDLYAKKGAKQDATDTYLKVARFYHEQGFFLKAVAVYKQILKLDPRLVDVILKLAELYRQLGLMSDAMQHFESVAAHFHREGNTKEALETVKKLVDLDPENIATRIKLAELYSKEGLVEEASTEFTVACDQLRRQNRQDDFVKVAERLLWHKPDNHALNRELAGLYLRRNDPRRALQKLQACFKADPRDVETLGLLAQAFQALDQKSKTVSVLKELARIHVDNKTRDKANEVYRKILEFVPNDPDALQFLGGGAPQPAAAAPPPPPAAKPPPPPVAPPARVTPPPRGVSTPMPALVRSGTANATFNLTGEMPGLVGPASTRMTGSMPLVDEQSLSGVDFALPEYDDGDFSADMEPPPDPRRASAAGERHAEEISKILAETDVYVKYGLHQKAVDHLRRVFTLDEQNVEAHERLKEIFVSQGREQEAEQELLKLAELVAPADPDRAEAYLQELLAINGTHTGAFELARKFRLRVARMSSVSSEVEYAGGGVAAVDGDDMDELELSAAPSSHPGHTGRPMGVARARDSVDDFDPDDLIGPSGVAHGSPAPARPPGPPAPQSRTIPAPPSHKFQQQQRPQPAQDDAFELDFEPSPSQATRQMSPEQAEMLAALPDDELEEPVLPQNSSEWSQPFDDYGEQQDASAAVDAQLDDAALGEDIDHEVAAELSAGDDMPFDPDEAAAFDAAVNEDNGAYVTGYEETDLPRVGPGGNPLDINTQSYEETDGSHAQHYDPYGTEAVQTPPYDPTAAHHVDTSSSEIDEEIPVEISNGTARAESLVEDELDEADFYVGQGMYAEAMESLQNIIERHPNHPLVRAKLREVQSLMTETPANGTEDHVGDPVEVINGEEPEGTDAIDLDEIMPADEDLEAVDAGHHQAPKRKMSVMLEKPVDEGDADTHYDLGLAYKEMGLWDEAIKAFEKSLRSTREVQSRLMIGMCYRDQGNAEEAIHQFKQGLHATAITEAERLSVYYEIGQTYEALGELGEAFYYFEMVTKRDPNFADAAKRAEALRSRARGAPRRRDSRDEI